MTKAIKICRLESLPTELVQWIATALHAHDLAALRLTCQKLQQKSNDIWTDRYLRALFVRAKPKRYIPVNKPNSQDLETILRILHDSEIASLVKSCRIDGRLGGQDVRDRDTTSTIAHIDKILILVPNIEDLTLAYLNVNGAEHDRFLLPAGRAPAIDQCSNLRTLFLQDCYFLDAHLSQLLESVGSTVKDLTLHVICINGDCRVVLTTIRDRMCIGNLRSHSLHYAGSARSSLLDHAFHWPVGIHKAFRVPGHGIQHYSIKGSLAHMFGGEAVKSGISKLLEMITPPPNA